MDGNQAKAGQSDSPAAAAGSAGAEKKRVRAGSYTTTHPKDPAAAGKELLEKLSQFIVQLGGNLGDGWKCDVKMVTVSELGDSGTCNATYITPGGKRMRSRGEVAKFLGLEVPTGKGARGGSGGSAAKGAAGGSGGAAAATAAVGADKAGATHDSHAGGHTPAKAAAAAAAGGSQDAEDDGMTKAEAYAAAVERAKKLEADGVQLPLTLKNGVVVEALGSIDLRPIFNTALALIPPGYRAVFKDAAVGQFVSEIRAQAGLPYPQFVVSLVPDAAVLQEVMHRQHSSSGGGAAGDVHVPGLGEHHEQQQQQQQQQDKEAPAPATEANGGDAPQTFQLAVARNADQVWAQVQGLQERAKLQVQAAAAAAAHTSDSGGPAAAPNSSSAAAAAGQGSGGGAGQPGGGQQQGGEAALDPLLAQLLAKAGSLQGCWGKAMFGFNEVEVLQLMEALPKADQTTTYQFVDERGGWEKEREFLAKGRWARRGTMQAGAKKVPSKKQQAGSSPAAAAAAGGDGAGGGKSGGGSGTPSKKRPHPASAAAAAAAANAGAPSSLFGTAAPKRYRSMAKEDRQVAEAVDKVLDKMIKRVETWWVTETAKEARKAEQAEARAAAKAAKAAEKAAAKAQADSAAAEAAAKAPMPPPSLQEDLTLPGASTPAPAAAPVLSILQGRLADQLLQVWEFACCFGPLLGLEQVPSPQQLERGLLGVVSHTGTSASAIIDSLRNGDAAAIDNGMADAAAAGADAPKQIPTAGADGTAAAAVAAAAAADVPLSAEQLAFDTAAGSAWVQLHIAVLNVLVQDVFTAVSNAVFDTENMRAAAMKELRAAMPVVDGTTWPEAARRLLAATATATFLAQGEPKSSATGSSARELDLPGQLRSMEVQDWAQYLAGGLNAPDLISRVALLPQGSSETAAESLLTLDDASALTAAEQLVQKLAKLSSSGNSNGDAAAAVAEAVGDQGAAATAAAAANAMDVDEPQQQQQQQQQLQQQAKGGKEHQLLLGRRLLQALVGVWGDKQSKNNSGKRMCFYAQELNPKLGRARGLDLHSVAARLEAGFYAATEDPLQALAADITLACDLWRDAFNTFDMSHEDAFRGGDARLADAVEDMLQDLMQQVAAGSDLAAAAGIADDTQEQQQQQQLAAAEPTPVKEERGAAAGAAADGDATVNAEGAATSADADRADAMDVDSPQQQRQQQQPPTGVKSEPAAAVKQEQPSAGNAAAAAAADKGQAGPKAEPSNAAGKSAAAEAGIDPTATAAAAAGCKPEEANREPSSEGDQASDEGPLPASATDPHSLKDTQRPFNALTGCRMCWSEGDKGRLLLCDGCEDEYHCYCVNPVLLEVPEGDWYCRLCRNSDNLAAAGPKPSAALAPAAAGSNCSSVSSTGGWDMAAAAQLPATCTAAVSSSSSGMQHIRELVGLAQRLSGCLYGSWPAEARLQLLLMLCELLASSNAGRRFIEERMDAKREAKKKVAEIRAKINKAKKEAAEAAKAAAKEAKAAKKAGGGSGKAGGSAAPSVEDTPAEDIKPTSKAGKSKKGAAAGGPAKLTRAHGPAEEPFDEETELRAIAISQQLMELSNVRRLQLGQDRFGNVYWLLGTSQLPVASDTCPTAGGPGSGPGIGSVAGPSGAAGDTAVAEGVSETAGSGKGGKGSKGSGGASSSGRGGMMGTYGCVFVQAAADGQGLLGSQAAAGAAVAAVPQKPGLPPPGPVNAAAAAALAAAAPASAASGAAAVAAAGGPSILGPLRDVLQAAAAGGAGADAEQQQQHTLLLPALSNAAAGVGSSACHKAAKGARQAAAGTAGPDQQQQAWGVFTSLAQIDAVLDWLNPQGIREGHLKTSLQRVRDNIVLFAPAPPQHAAGAEGGAQQQEQQQTFSSRAGTPAIAGVTPPPQPAAAGEKQQHGTSRLQRSSGSSTLQHQQHLEPAAVAAMQQQLVAAAAADDDSAAAEALRDGLSKFMLGLPEVSMHSFWGSSRRCEAWKGALAVAQRPPDFAALIAQLEVMLLTDSWRMGWQLWAQPAQNPALVQTWPQVWYRFLGLEAARLPSLPTKQQRERARWQAIKAQSAADAGAGSGQQQQQQQQRKRPRYVEEDDLDDFDDLDDERVQASGRNKGWGARQQQQQQRQQPGGRLTCGRQQPQQQQYFGHSSRAAATKAAAAIAQQSRALTGGDSVGRGRRGRGRDSDFDDEFDDFDSSSEDNDEGPGSDDDSALAAALAASHSHYPRRAAAVAATAAIAASSGHQPPAHGRHTRAHQQQHRKKQRQQPARGAATKGDKKGGSGRAQRGSGGSKGRGRAAASGVDSDEDEIEDFKSSEEPEEELDLPESEPEKSEEEQSEEKSEDDQVNEEEKSEEGGDADDAISEGSSDDEQQQQQQQQRGKAQANGPKAGSKGSSPEAPSAPAADVGAEADKQQQQQQPAGKKQKVQTSPAAQQQPAAAATGNAAAGAAAGTAANKQQQQQQKGQVGAAAHGPAAAAAKNPAAGAAAGGAGPGKIRLKGAPPPAKSKQQAVHDLFGAGAFKPLSSAAPSAGGGSKGTAAAGPAAGGGNKVSVSGAGGKPAAVAAAAGGGAKHAEHAPMNPKKALLQRHAEELRRQSSEGTAGHGSGGGAAGAAAAADGKGRSAAAAAVGGGSGGGAGKPTSPRAGGGATRPMSPRAGGAGGKGHGATAVGAPAAPANPKVASKDAMSFDDEDDD